MSLRSLKNAALAAVTAPFAASLACLLLCRPVCRAADIPVLRPVVVKTYPHDPKAYTQGLFFNDGALYESTGQNGRSSIRKVDLATGKVLQKKDLDKRYFGEGSAIAGGRLYMLTWTSCEALVFEPDGLRLLETIKYPREGWGLAALPDGAGQEDGVPCGALMVASDGSSNLYFLSDRMAVLRTLRVTMEGRPVKYLNELEWIDGKIWANVYTTDVIVVVDPRSGTVEKMIDCSQLIPRSDRTPDMDVLNGIAADAAGNVYLTGKNWPKLFKVTFR